MYKWLPGEHIKCHQRHAQRPDEFDTSPKAGLDAIIFAGPEVLRRIVGNAVAERGKGRDNHVVELHRRRVACHDGRAEAVDDALDDDVADGNKALLQDARNDFMAKLMNIGFGNMVNTDKIVSIISSDSAPAKRMISRGKEQEILIDATQGRRTKSVIFTENNKIILSALQPETLAGRFNGNASEGDYDTKE